MKEAKNEIVHGKLNLNVPPLLTRRVSGSTAISGSRLDPANMVPFSWERIPGEPKDRGNSSGDDVPPPPKPPPARWRPSVRVDDLDLNLDGSEENNDGIDIFSLAESVDDVEGYCKATEERSSSILLAEGDDWCSPNFIIERFLPDAQALAEESVMDKKLPYSDSRAVSIGRLKGCGLASFLPWKMQPKSCKIKTPVCDTIIGPNLKHKRS
ncbi:uncharacterized protein LOC121762448 [Salvia splendens]|nr:uncharacterized protein LOC121762448 [Salvia splendens]